MTASRNPLYLRTELDRILSFAEVDANWRAAMRWCGLWASGDTYVVNQVVRHNGALWVANTTTTDTPSVASADWDPIVPYPGQGSMYLATPPAATTDLGAGWQTVDGFDSVDPLVQGITFSTAANTFRFDWAGVWDWVLYLNISHNELNQSRESNVRLYNETDAAAVESVPFYIARNQGGSMLSIPVRQLITPTEQGKVWRLEIGGGDTVSLVAYEALSMDFTQISAY